MISIIIPTLNEEKFLPHLLDSLARQTKKDFEVIVVDGKSRDKTVTVARSYAKKLPHLQVILSPKASLPLQRNLGARASRGNWLVFVDADSILMPYFLERIHQFIQSEKPLVCTTWVKPDSMVPKDAMFALLANLYLEAALLFKQPHPPGPLSCIRRDIFETVGGYDESHAYYEDVELGIRLRQKHIPFAVLRETLYVWSLRRFRQEGTLKVIQQYIITSLPVLFFQRAVKHMPGYIMGGHVYDKKKRSAIRVLLRTYERKLKKLIQEFFI